MIPSDLLTRFSLIRTRLGSLYITLQQLQDSIGCSSFETEFAGATKQFWNKEYNKKWGFAGFCRFIWNGSSRLSAIYKQINYLITNSTRIIGQFSNWTELKEMTIDNQRAEIERLRDVLDSYQTDSTVGVTELAVEEASDLPAIERKPYVKGCLCDLIAASKGATVGS